MTALKVVIQAVVVLSILTAGHTLALSNKQLEAQFVLLPSGDRVSMDSLKGKPLDLKFWATWCQTCLQQMPHFQKVQETIGKDIRIIAVNVGLEDSAKDVQKMAAEFGLSMTMAMDEQGELAHALGLWGTPFHLLFDKNLQLLYAGHNADTELDQKLQLLSSSIGGEDGSALEFFSAEPLLGEASTVEFQVPSKGRQLLYFSATWCDWYLKESRPRAARNCELAQAWLNGLTEVLPKSTEVHAILSRLWADESELEKYRKKHQPKHPLHVDLNNSLFHRYQVNQLPTLIVFEGGEEVLRVSYFGQKEALKALEAKVLKF